MLQSDIIALHRNKPKLKLYYYYSHFEETLETWRLWVFVFFWRWWSCRGLARWPGIPLKLLHMEQMKLHQICTWKHKKLCFSSKHGFEEKSITEHVIMEIIVVETLVDLLMRLLTVLERFEDLIDETLDLMRPKTLTMTFVNLKTKIDCRWPRCMKMG